jgi:diguanylate cyclase (GGDEF)-like protein
MFTTLRHRRLLAVGAGGAYAVVFVAFVLFERPGLGVAHFFYIPVGLLALSSGARTGAAAGGLATALFAAGIFLNPNVPPTELPTASTAIRFVTFVLIGTAFGWFASRNRSLFDDLQALADRDFLTGLPNARCFEEELSRRLALGDRFALLLADADGLKAINDEHGHDEGDRLIRDVSQALQQATRPGDHVSRVGGDEFAVIAATDGRAAALHMCSRLEEVVTGAGHLVTFGLAIYPDDGEQKMMLYRAADRRLYERKPSRRSQAAVFRIAGT